ncbi:hypothetical protein SELMODRAFT_120972 [Selaginella moellendorffii]|uniref:Uncharacterized protein n=1 Tax=Selaginella moellendorffii TaxID=88036 RepID=D8SN92_SELML|nr:hypothetical protein SELMODRAFT_120972 [Selaginella moellendorffii]
MRWLIDCIQDYDRVQSLAVVLLYVQVSCALIGSLGALYTGVLLANLAIALFALVAIESGSQTLGRAYAALLVCALLLDILWFIFFSYEIRHYGRSPRIGTLSIFSLELALWMEIIGFTVRSFSALVWLQMYRLGPSLATDSLASYYQSLVQPAAGATPAVSTPRSARQTSISDQILGGSIYDPTYYASLFRIQEKENCSSSSTKVGFYNLFLFSPFGDKCDTSIRAGHWG